MLKNLFIPLFRILIFVIIMNVLAIVPYLIFGTAASFFIGILAGLALAFSYFYYTNKDDVNNDDSFKEF